MIPTRVDLDDTCARFRVGDAVVGDYVLDDAHKPYLHPLRTLSGRVVSLAMPSDHRHHKGLMYALSATDVNWWEEEQWDDHAPIVGVQRILSTHRASDDSIAQDLLWTAHDGSRETLRERRHISCVWDDRGFVRWSWTADFEVLRDVTLQQSPASVTTPSGRRVNYHGLGIRFPRSFGFQPEVGTWEGDGTTGAAELMGARPRRLRVTDRLDGEIPAPTATVRVSQIGSDHGVFTMQHPFSYLAIGPTILPGTVDLVAGSTFHEEYLVDVADGTLAAP